MNLSPARVVPSFVATLLALSCTAAGSVPILTWTGAGPTSRWSDPGNWAPGRLPADGDGVVFAGPSSTPSSLVDLSVRLDHLTFAASAGLFPVHVAGDGGRALTFTGPGVQNLTGGTGPIRQGLFADAGSTGGSIVFAGASGINLGSDPSYRPVDLTAAGATVAGQLGGRVVFQDQSSTGTSTFNALRAGGAGVAGAGAGELAFRDNATASRFTTLTLAGGSGTGALGASATFADDVRIDGAVNLLGGTSGGAGGRATFSGRAVAGLTSLIGSQGGNGGVGSEGATEFRDTSRLMGSATNGAATVAGGSGGRLEFRGQSRFDSTGYDGSLGALQIINSGASVAGAGGGTVVFRDDSSARGANLVISNRSAESAGAGALGGITRFLDRSRAGELTIFNESGPNATAAGLTVFQNSANGENARIENRGGRVATAAGGETRFQDTASAGHATIVNGAGEVGGASGGTTRFSGNAGAGNATIANEQAAGGGGGRGSAYFADSSSAQNARIDNRAGLPAIGAFTNFSQSASAGTSTITNFGGLAAGAGGGSTNFLDQATAGAATLVMAAGAGSGGAGGQTSFFANSTAADATLDLRGATVAGALGGRANFLNSASAGNARVTVQGSQANDPAGPGGATVVFNINATASRATFLVGGNASAFGDIGRVQFNDSSTAGDATLTTLAGYDRGGRVSFEGTPFVTASAGNARITNGSRDTASGSTGDFGGATLFLAHSTADHASIVNEAGRTAFGAQTVFRGDSTAASASIVNAGGRAGETGGITFFLDSSSAGRATLTAEGGRDGGSGGRIVFADQATGGTARVVLGAGSGANGAGVLDIGGVAVWLTIGSLEGGGRVELGSRTLIVGDRQPTTFSGVIRGDAPPVFPSLAVFGSLTLTGENTYAGRTSIGDGLNPDSGKLVAANVSGSATGSGDVLIQRGGTLAGSGFVAGPVRLLDGGTIAPGDPVTLTLRNSLTWDGGGLVRLVLGADSAGSDHLRVGTLIRGDAGPFVFDLVDFGITPGAEYDLLSFDALVGFTAADFEARGYGGTFAIDHGAIAFTAFPTVTAVPEPSTYAFFLLGLVATACARRRGRRAASPISPA